MSKKQDDQKNEVVEEVVVDQAVGDDESSELEQLRQELDLLKTNFDGAQDQLKRAVADYHNLERRIAEGRSELGRWATSELIQKVLPVLDNLERTLNGLGEEERKSGWVKGVELSAKQLKQVLKDEGLEEIGADGQFDPALHEAVDIREGENEQILEVAEKGYNLNGKVLRPVKVVVGRKSN